MRQKSVAKKSPAEQVIRDIRRKTRKRYGSEEKIRIVLDGLRGEDSIAELCRREGINQNLYYRWCSPVSGSSATIEHKKRLSPPPGLRIF